MTVLRATRKVLRSLPRTASEGDVSTTALGDWYVNRIVVHRQPFLLYVSSRSLLALLLPARDVRHLAGRFPQRIADRLRRLGGDLLWVAAEEAAMQPVLVGRTQDRSVLGTMVDFAKALPYCLPSDGWEPQDLLDAQHLLARTPCRCGRAFEEVIWPGREALRLLEERWRSPATAH